MAERKRQNGGPTPVLNLLGLVLVIGSSVAISYVYNGDLDHYDAGRFFGSYILVALIVAALVTRVDAVKQNLGMTLCIGLVMVAGAVLELNGNGIAFEGRMTYTQAHNLKYALQDLMIGSMTGVPSKETDVGPLPAGFQEFIDLVRQHNQAMILAQSNYQHVIESEDFANILLPLSLSRAIEPAPMIFAQAFDSLKQYQHTVDDYFQNLPTMVNQLNINKAMREKLIQGWESSGTDMEQLAQDFFKNQHDSLTTLLMAYQLCARSSTGYDPNDGKLVFYDDQTLHQFNDLMEELERLAAEEEALLLKQQQMQTQVIKNMQEAFSKI